MLLRDPVHIDFSFNRPAKPQDLVSVKVNGIHEQRPGPLGDLVARLDGEGRAVRKQFLALELAPVPDLFPAGILRWFHGFIRLSSSAPMNESAKAVFLSYTSQDADAARRICDALQAAGLEVWLDQSELRGGDAWDAAIRRQIKACTLFMPVISANTSARVEGYFRLEWKLAIDRSHLIAAERAFILPVVIDATRDTDALVPDKFREVQWTHCPAGEVSGKFVERVTKLLSPDPPASGSMAVPAPARPHSRRNLALAGAAIAVALLAVAAIVAHKTVLHSSEINMVAVMPFENATGDSANEYLTDGISDSLINKLAALKGLHVISRTSAFALKGLKLDPMQIASKLGADALLLGSLTQHGSNLSITAELVSGRDATHLWGEKYARSADDVLLVEGEIATTIAQALHRQLSGEEKGQLAHNDTSDPEAYRLYLKGREFLLGTQAEMDKSVDYFRQAIARAPDYALAHAGLGEAYARQAFLRASGRAEALGKARAAVTRSNSIQISPKPTPRSARLMRFSSGTGLARKPSTGVQSRSARAIAMSTRATARS